MERLFSNDLFSVPDLEASERPTLLRKRRGSRPARIKKDRCEELHVRRMISGIACLPRFEYLRCGSGPKRRLLQAASPPPHLRPRTPPPHQPGPPPPGALQKEPCGWGKREGRVGRKGLWLEGRVLQLQWGWEDPPKGSWGQTHIWGLSTRLVCKKEHPVRGRKRKVLSQSLVCLLPGRGETPQSAGNGASSRRGHMKCHLQS